MESHTEISWKRPMEDKLLRAGISICMYVKKSSDVRTGVILLLINKMHSTIGAKCATHKQNNNDQNLFHLIAQL